MSKNNLLNKISVSCSTCSQTHDLLSTNKDITIDVCSKCHPFYTGDSSIARAAGRIERFNRRSAAINKK